MACLLIVVPLQYTICYIGVLPLPAYHKQLIQSLVPVETTVQLSCLVHKYHILIRARWTNVKKLQLNYVTILKCDLFPTQWHRFGDASNIMLLFHYVLVIAYWLYKLYLSLITIILLYFSGKYA